MKLLKVTYEHRAYTEDDAKIAIIKFRAEAEEKGYRVGAAGYTYKAKKKKGEVVAEAGVVSVLLFMTKSGMKEKVHNGRD